MSGFADLIFAGLLGIISGIEIENTNIAGYEEQQHAVDFNRLRADLTLEHQSYSDILARLTVDNETIYMFNPDSLRNKTSIYRAYLQHRGMKHFWSVGNQRIPLGVGRVWNPIDLFNPINSESIETDERPGTESIRYEYAVSDLSNVDVTAAKEKGVIRIKGFLDYVDVALVGVWDGDRREDIIGWELEGQLFETGFDLRSEGGSFHNRSTGDRYTEFIIGAEYGYENSLILLTEYRYSDDTSSDYLAGMATYQPAMLWFCSLLVLGNLNDSSGFIAPSVEYSLSDEMTLSAGFFIYCGSDDDEFATAPDRYYLRWFVHF